VVRELFVEGQGRRDRFLGQAGVVQSRVMLSAPAVVESNLRESNLATHDARAAKVAVSIDPFLLRLTPLNFPNSR
jgi:hypothetical protein